MKTNTEKRQTQQHTRIMRSSPNVSPGSSSRSATSRIPMLNRLLAGLIVGYLRGSFSARKLYTYMCARFR